MTATLLGEARQCGIAAQRFATAQGSLTALASPTAPMTAREVTYCHDLSLPARSTPSLAPGPMGESDSFVVAVLVGIVSRG